MIYPVRMFISKLGDVQDDAFDKLYGELIADGFPSDELAKDWLFDYMFNSDPEEDPQTLEEFSTIEVVQ